MMKVTYVTYVNNHKLQRKKSFILSHKKYLIL